MSVLQDARTGDLQAFEQLVRQYQAEIYGHALKLTGQHPDAVEVAQDVFIDLYTAIARIASHSHLRHWLLRAVAQRARERGWQQDVEIDSGVADPGPEFTTRVVARVELRWSHRRADFVAAKSRKRGWHRGVVFGVVVIIGMAAILIPWMYGKLHNPPSAAIDTPAAATTRDAPRTETPVRSDVAIAMAPASSRTATRDAFPQHTVIVLPVRHASLDANSIAPVEAFHAALITELRRIPGMVLLVPGVTAPPDTLQSADYLLAVTSLAAQALPSGGTAFRITGSSGSLTAGSAASGRQWPVEIRIRPTRQSSPATLNSTLQVGDDSTLLPQLAAQQVEMLRARLFPDALVKQQLMSRIRDASLSAMERNSALDDLLGTQRGREPGLDAIDVGNIVAGAAAMPADERARLWRSLRGSATPEMVETLVDSMRRDPDIGVRFEALATLAADYGNEARVRTAIDNVSREDPAQVMRVAAKRSRSGDDEWRRYLVDLLKDTTLPWPERLAPLLLAGKSAITPAETLSMRTIINDEAITNALVGMIRDNWFDYTQAQTIGDALELLTSSGSADVSGLLVEIPQGGSRAVAAVPAYTQAPQISPAAMSWLQKNRSNPRARRMLDDLARGKVDPQMEFMIEQMQRAPRRQ